MCDDWRSFVSYRAACKERDAFKNRRDTAGGAAIINLSIDLHQSTSNQTTNPIFVITHEGNDEKQEHSNTRRWEEEEGKLKNRDREMLKD